MIKKFCSENVKGRYHSEDLNVDVKKYYNVSLRFMLLRIGTSEDSN